MNFKNYIKDKFKFIILNVAQIIAITLILSVVKLNIISIVLIITLIVACNTMYLVEDYKKKRDFYNDFLETINVIERPIEITKLIKHPEFFEGDALCDTINFLSESVNTELKQTRNMYIPFISAFNKALTSVENENDFKILNEQFNIFSLNTMRTGDRTIIQVKDTVIATLRFKSQKLVDCKIGVSIKNLGHSILTDAKMFADIVLLLVIHAYCYAQSNVKIYCETAPDSCITFEYSTMLEGTIPTQLILAETLCTLLGLRFKIYQTDHTYVKIFYTLEEV